MGDLIYNDEVLFLATDPYENAKTIPFGYGTTGAILIPRSDLDIFRKVFVDTYKKYKYKVCTMRQFKYLYRRYVFGYDGIPLETGWDLTMDHVMFKQDRVNDNDRKILMPQEWIKESTICSFYADRVKSYEDKTTGSYPPRSTESTGINFDRFPDFVNH